jgi:hypothetical protein
MCDALDGLKSFYRHAPQVNKFHPSHLSSFGISFSVILQGTNVSLILGSFFNIRGFTLGSSHHVVIIARSLS